MNRVAGDGWRESISHHPPTGSSFILIVAGMTDLYNES
jgi:hypothetical protein